MVTVLNSCKWYTSETNRLLQEGKLGLRWRTEKEVVSGKGQFVCGAKVWTLPALLQPLSQILLLAPHRLTPPPPLQQTCGHGYCLHQMSSRCKGFACPSAQGCHERGGLASFEVNFVFEEAGIAKAALVKLRLCPKHALHLNYQRNQLALQVRGISATE